MNHKPMRTEFDAANNRWVFFVPFAMPDSVILSAKNYVKKINLDRWLSASGDLKEKIAIGLKALDENRIVQSVNGKGDIAIFQSTQKMHDTTYVDFGNKKVIT